MATPRTTEKAWMGAVPGVTSVDVGVFAKDERCHMFRRSSRRRAKRSTNQARLSSDVTGYRNPAIRHATAVGHIAAATSPSSCKSFICRAFITICEQCDTAEPRQVRSGRHGSQRDRPHLSSLHAYNMTIPLLSFHLALLSFHLASDSRCRSLCIILCLSATCLPGEQGTSERRYCAVSPKSRTAATWSQTSQTSTTTTTTTTGKFNRLLPSRRLEESCYARPLGF